MLELGKIDGQDNVPVTSASPGSKFRAPENPEGQIPPVPTPPLPDAGERAQPPAAPVPVPENADTSSSGIQLLSPGGHPSNTHPDASSSTSSSYALSKAERRDSDALRHRGSSTSQTTVNQPGHPSTSSSHKTIESLTSDQSNPRDFKGDYYQRYEQSKQHQELRKLIADQVSWGAELKNTKEDCNAYLTKMTLNQRLSLVATKIAELTAEMAILKQAAEDTQAIADAEHGARKQKENAADAAVVYSFAAFTTATSAVVALTGYSFQGYGAAGMIPVLLVMAFVAGLLFITYRCHPQNGKSTCLQPSVYVPAVTLGVSTLIGSAWVLTGTKDHVTAVSHPPIFLYIVLGSIGVVSLILTAMAVKGCYDGGKLGGCPCKR